MSLGKFFFVIFLSALLFFGFSNAAYNPANVIHFQDVGGIIFYMDKYYNFSSPAGPVRNGNGGYYRWSNGQFCGYRSGNGFWVCTNYFQYHGSSGYFPVKISLLDVDTLFFHKSSSYEFELKNSDGSAYWDIEIREDICTYIYYSALCDTEGFAIGYATVGYPVDWVPQLALAIGHPISSSSVRDGGGSSGGGDGDGDYVGPVIPPIAGSNEEWAEMTERVWGVNSGMCSTTYQTNNTLLIAKIWDYDYGKFYGNVDKTAFLVVDSDTQRETLYETMIVNPQPFSMGFGQPMDTPSDELIANWATYFSTNSQPIALSRLKNYCYVLTQFNGDPFYKGGGDDDGSYNGNFGDKTWQELVDEAERLYPSFNPGICAIPSEIEEVINGRFWLTPNYTGGFEDVISTSPHTRKEYYDYMPECDTLGSGYNYQYCRNMMNARDYCYAQAEIYKGNGSGTLSEFTGNFVVVPPDLGVGEVDFLNLFTSLRGYFDNGKAFFSEFGSVSCNNGNLPYLGKKRDILIFLVFFGILFVFFKR